jgi:hypothetical protein
MNLAYAAVLPEPETRIFVLALYALLGVMSAYQLHRLMRVVAKPLVTTSVPSQRVPMYPGEYLGTVDFTWGRGAKVLKIIALSVSALICMGGMYVALAAGYRREYIEFVGWNSLSHNLLLAGHLLWPVTLWVLAIVRAKPAAIAA